MRDQRFCATCQRFRGVECFSRKGVGLSRACTPCQAARRVAAEARRGRPPTQQPMTGVDIDAVHHKLGAVKGRLRPT